MKRMMMMMMMTGCVMPVFAGTRNVNASKSNYVTVWNTGGLPTQPNVEWWLGWGDGNTQDLTNHGSTPLATQLTNGNPPDPAEGILFKDQSASSFDGINDYLQINNPSVLDNTGQSMSIGEWVMPRKNTGYHRLVCKGTSQAGSHDGYQVFCYNGTDYHVTISDSAHAQILDVNAPNAVHLNQWQFVLMTFDWTTKTCSLYVDGIYTAKGSDADIVSISSPYKFLIGTTGSFSSYANEVIAWVGIWTSTAITNAQQAALYTAMAPTGTTSKPYPSIQSAIRQATAGDIISIAAGTYQETVDVTKALTITASNFVYPNRPVIYGANLPLTAGVNAITNLSSAAPAVSYLDIRGYYRGVAIYDSLGGSSGVWRGITSDSCLIGFWESVGATTDSICNCTIDGAGLASSYGIYGVATAGAKTLFCYNTVLSNLSHGIVAGHNAWTITENYNDFWNCTVRDSLVTDGAQSIAVLPQFRGGDDYRLRWTSPLRTGGANSYLLSRWIGAYPAIYSGSETWMAGFGQIGWKGGF